MLKVILFQKNGLYSGFKEYEKDPNVFNESEYTVTEEQWLNKESLVLIDGVVSFSKEENRIFLLKMLKFFVRNEIERQAYDLDQPSSLELISYIEDDYNLFLQRQAKAFIKWRGYVISNLGIFGTDLEIIIPSAETFMSGQYTFEECLNKA